VNVDLAELVAAMVFEAGGSVVINAENVGTFDEDKAIAIDYDTKREVFLLTLVDARDVEFEDDDA